ncbi:NUDIX hydrolase [Micrococcus sp.]|uniref:NUDIX hydrolase n=1 Tax=Micrococcus sp. TaxID=1271 RepID=UPI002A90D32A|nr:NUDIX hydrolase [Micrococcus sp.]MDY6055288.1 NUDIX hydrolase [Micrococcus sp.]
MSADTPGGPAGFEEPVALPAEDEGLARQWLAQRHRQVRPARPASAVVLVRDGRDGVEVLLRHRAGRTPLGRVGFPGGSLLESDADPCPWFGPEPAVWSRRLGIADRRRVRQRVVAAVRELFEESGVLLAGHTPDEIAEDARGESWGAHRSSLETGDVGLPEVLRERGLGLRTDLLRPVGRWHSTPHSPRRFDTVVFAAALPPQQRAAGRPDALTHQAWCPVRALLSGPVALPGPEGWLGEEGVAELAAVTVPLTQIVLRRVAGHRTAAGFLLSLGGGGTVVPEYRLRTAAEPASREIPDGRLWAVPELVGESQRER